MKQLLNQYKVLVCVGSGGVGKTTVSASLAVLAALEGKRVLVLTVDPARRLATTLGIESGTERVIEFPESGGVLKASIIDAKEVFDEFVKKASSRGANSEKLFNNKLYKQLSTTLSGSQEFTALEKLYSCYQSNEFDLIVLDTPPTEHAIDFLNAPQNISALFDERISKWFAGGSGGGLLGGLLSMGTKKAFSTLESLTGSEFIGELRSFFEIIQDWRSNLSKRTSDVHRLLVSPNTGFVLVTSFDRAKLIEADRFRKEITKSGYSLSQVIINRAYPEWLNPDLDGVEELSTENDGLKQLIDYHNRLTKYFKERMNLYEAFEEQIKSEVNICRLPFFEEDVSDLEGLKKLARIMV